MTELRQRCRTCNGERVQRCEPSCYSRRCKSERPCETCNGEGAVTMYPCAKCGKLRTKAEGGTIFTVCDDCWFKSVTVPIVALLCVLMLTGSAEAQSLRPRTLSDYSLAFGLNLNLRSSSKPYRYNVPLPRLSELPPIDGILTHGAVITRTLVARDRGKPGTLILGRAEGSTLEQTHPSDPIPGHGPSYDTPRNAVLGEIVAERSEGGRWVEGSKLVFTRSRLWVVLDGEAVLLAERAGALE